MRIFLMTGLISSFFAVGVLVEQDLQDISIHTMTIALPPRKLFGNFDEDVIEERRISLGENQSYLPTKMPFDCFTEIFLNNILHDPDRKRCQPFLSFIGISPTQFLYRFDE